MAHLRDFTAPIPVTADIITETITADFGDITGQMLVNYTYKGRDTTQACCDAAEIVGFHIGSGIVLSRDELVQIIGKQAVAFTEATYAELRGML